MTQANSAAMQFLRKRRSPIPEESDSFQERFEAQSFDAVSSFRGMFGEGQITSEEEERLQQLLMDHFDPAQNEETQIQRDFRQLRTICSEVRAIAHQSILLHGERIQKAQGILKKYKEGAFTQWLVTTYGNRRTPYSYLQYFEFYQQLPDKQLKERIESMPRQAAYALASRPGTLKQKIEIIERYEGQAQREMVALIQELLPIDAGDQRAKGGRSGVAIQGIQKLVEQLKGKQPQFSFVDKERIVKLIQELQDLI